MTLVAEGMAALRGCWRLIMEPDYDFSDFNLSIEGFWRSFSVLVPLSIIAYPLFLSSNLIDIAVAGAEGEPPPPRDLTPYYLYLFAAVILWPIVAAGLARLFNVTQNYVRYLIVYNWMLIPTMLLGLLPHAAHLLSGSSGVALMATSLIVLIALAYVSWFVARRALEAGPAIAAAFVAADYTTSYLLESLAGV